MKLQYDTQVKRKAAVDNLNDRWLNKFREAGIVKDENVQLFLSDSRLEFLLKKEDGRSVFGSNFDLRYLSSYGKDKTLDASMASCGSFTPEDKATVFRVTTMARVLEQWDTVVEFVKESTSEYAELEAAIWKEIEDNKLNE